MSARTDTEAESNARSSGITPTSLKASLIEKLEAEYVDVEDMSGGLHRPAQCESMLISLPGGCGAMFEAIIVSPQFAKKTTLARHRMVNGALKDEIAAIHAWTPKCYTPDEWRRKKEE